MKNELNSVTRFVAQNFLELSFVIICITLPACSVPLEPIKAEYKAEITTEFCWVFMPDTMFIVEGFKKVDLNSKPGDTINFVIACKVPVRYMVLRNDIVLIDKNMTEFTNDTVQIVTY